MLHTSVPAYTQEKTIKLGFVPKKTKRNYNFTSNYIRTRRYTVPTEAGLSPFLELGSGVPQGGAEGPFLNLLVTLLLPCTIEQDCPP